MKCDVVFQGVGNAAGQSVKPGQILKEGAPLTVDFEGQHPDVEIQNIIAALDKPQVFGDSSVEISGVTHDSRKVSSGWLFVALRGELTDGHDFISQAIDAGAAAIMAEKAPEPRFGNLPWIVVSDTRMALGNAAAAFNGLPTEKLVLVGITGTNGKTTLTFLLESIMNAAGGFPGVVGTITHRWGVREEAAANTTPEASDLQVLFSRMVEDGVTHAFVEVSSHGLHRGRLEGCEFDLGVFTNLTQDHLDYHGSFEEYFLAKQILFNRLLPASAKKRVSAVVNMDDAYGRRLADEISGVPVIGYGVSEICDVRPLKVKVDTDGVSGIFQTPRGELELNSKLAGSFNLVNILAAVAVCEKLNVPTDAIRNGIAAVEAVPGRLERVWSDDAIVFVDYAHTPIALKKRAGSTAGDAADTNRHRYGVRGRQGQDQTTDNGSGSCRRQRFRNNNVRQSEI